MSDSDPAGHPAGDPGGGPGEGVGDLHGHGGREWYVYRGTGQPHDGIESLPDPPPWRRFGARFDGGALAGAGAGSGSGSGSRVGELLDPPVEPIGSRPAAELRARTYRPDSEVIEAVNAALFLRRPLLVTGRPGTGKSTLAFSIAHELRLGPVLYWPVTSRSVLRDALYDYDAIGRLQDANLRRGNGSAGEGRHGAEGEVPDIGRYLRLAPLGTALLPWRRPRVLLIDELDKGDIDLPNDLLNVFEEGEFDVPELARVPRERQPVTVSRHDGGQATIRDGKVRCHAFPIVVITNNGEREFPPAFLRRCLSLRIQQPSEAMLREIVAAHLGDGVLAEAEAHLTAYLAARNRAEVSTDQLLNLVFLAGGGRLPSPEEGRRLVSLLLQRIDETP